MSIDINSLVVRLTNIKLKCEQLLLKEHNYYSFNDYGHLFSNFEGIRKLLTEQYPGAFDDIPERQLRTETFEFDQHDRRIGYNSFETLKDDVDDSIAYLSNIPTDIHKIPSMERSGDCIHDHVRRDIFDFLRLTNPCWNGRLDEIEFLNRIYKVDELPSTDQRFTTAAGDIWQHRINNEDWPQDWIYSDHRFQLSNGPDSILLDFLCQTVHPLVKDNEDEAAFLVSEYNKHLSKVGWQIVPQTKIAERSLYMGVKSYSSLLKAQLDPMHQVLSTEYITQLISRMHSSIETDPELAIGSAKELLESVCKTILNDRKIAMAKDDTLQQLVKKTMKELKLDPDDMPHTTKAMDSIKPMLKSLGTIAHMMAELRGQFGTGHGKDARTKGLGPRHARLAVGAAASMAVFLHETYIERESKVTQPDPLGFGKRFPLFRR